MIKKYFYFLFFLFFFLSSCNKVNYSTPKSDKKTNSVVLNNIKINKSNLVVIYGDTRNNYEVHRKIVSLFLEKNPAMVFNTGDLVYDGNINELWPIFLDIIKPIIKTARYYPVLGNHERNSDNYFKIFNLPNNKKWYKIDFKNISFFVLDSNSDLGKKSKQYLWLEEKLKKNKSDFKILIFHHPLFSVGRHGGSKYLQDNLNLLINQYNIDIVFSGHDHAYERFFKNNTHYVVTGGGGAPLYDKVDNSSDEKYLKKYIKDYHYCLLDIKGKKLDFKVYDIKNNLIDNIFIEKK